MSATRSLTVAKVLEPFGNRVLIRPHEAVTTTKGGIAIPDRAQKVPTRGTVLAVGRGDWEKQDLPLADLVWDDDTPVVPPVGATVWYSQYGGSTIRVNDEDLIILQIGDILAVETEEEAA